MKKLSKLFLLSLLPMFVLSGCQKRENNPNPYGENNKLVASVTLDVQGQVELDIGGTVMATPTITYKDNQEVEVNKLWKSSRPSVASVDNGTVVALSVGKSTISFIAGLKMAFFDVIIKGEEGGSEGQGSEVDPDEFSISINPTSKSLVVGETFAVLVTLNNTDKVDDPSYTLTSDKPSVASVTEQGIVTANAEGTANIVATSNGKSATCVVNVSSEGEEEKDYDCEIFFFIDYNNIDENDETGTKLIRHFEWYTDKPLALSGKVPQNPTHPLDPAFPYFVGWSSHTIIDSLDDLWKMDTDVVGSAHFLYLYGIWSDVPSGS